MNAFSFEIENFHLEIQHSFNSVPEINQYNQLINQIGTLMVLGRAKTAQEVNTIRIQTYREIGKYIVEFEQKGNEKAEY